MTRRSLDLIKEFAGTFRGQTPLVFFDLEILDRKGTKAATGLCKISASPKPGPGSRYLSLVLVTDVPDPLLGSEVKGVLDSICEERLKEHLPQVQYTVTPPLLTTTASLVKQIDIMLDPGLPVDQRTVCEKLCAAIRAVQGIKAGEPIWWEASATALDGTQMAREGAEAGERSLVQRLRVLLGRR